MFPGGQQNQRKKIVDIVANIDIKYEGGRICDADYFIQAKDGMI